VEEEEREIAVFFDGSASVLHYIVFLRMLSAEIFPTFHIFSRYENFPQLTPAPRVRSSLLTSGIYGYGSLFPGEIFFPKSVPKSDFPLFFPPLFLLPAFFPLQSDIEPS